MRRAAFLLFFLTPVFFSKAQRAGGTYPEYKGSDLGLSFTPKRSGFRIWAPTASAVKLRIYDQPLGGTSAQTLEMRRAKNGTWTASIRGNLSGKYYTFSIQHNGAWLDEVPDPYAKLVGTNGKRAMVADLAETDPADWKNDRSPVRTNKTDAIVYELQVRDAGMSANSGIRNKGKFLGLAESGTRNSAGLATGLDHLAELGVTDIHLLPFFDFQSIDETKDPNPGYNWGYDPQNYNVPEGSFSTNAADGRVRIRELKEMIGAFHRRGLRVVMDVVYNHTGATEKSNFNQLVPGYYYRYKADGSLSDASACGNEMASEQPMMRKFMIESLLFWVKEYHIDGFRFDLMGIHDIETMNQISAALHQIKPDILLYGEGWTAGASPLPEAQRAIKKNAAQLDRIAVFSDDIRDGIKGSVFDHKDRGFASNKPGMEESIKFGIVAACLHPQIDYAKVNYSKAPYAREPWHTISYAECHDNHVLWDRLAISAAAYTEQERMAMHQLALSIVLTSQGISFLHAGTEFLRSKKEVENSYNSSDSINAIDWDLKTKHKEVFDYVRSLIQMRKTHPAFRMATAEQIRNNIRFIEMGEAGCVGYELNGAAVKDSWKKIMVYFNGTNQPVETAMPSGAWKAAVRNNRFESGAPTGSLNLEPFSCSVIYMD